MFRIGQSRDIHRFKEGDHIVLGGVNIPHTKGMEAYLFCMLPFYLKIGTID